MSLTFEEKKKVVSKIGRIRSRGDFFAGLSKRVSGVASVEIAELLGGYEALQFARKAVFRDIVSEGDNLAVISLLNDKADGLVNGGVIISDILSLARSCRSCLFSFVIKGYGV